MLDKIFFRGGYDVVLVNCEWNCLYSTHSRRSHYVYHSFLCIVL